MGDGHHDLLHATVYALGKVSRSLDGAHVDSFADEQIKFHYRSLSKTVPKAGR